MRQLSRFRALKVIHDTGGKIFSAQFVKKDGSTRNMVARIGVNKNLQGGTNSASAKNNLVTVYDMAKGGYRMINLKTLLTLKASGETYEVV